MRNRVKKRSPGKKRGATINNTLALKPNGVKSLDYELDARVALVAMENNKALEKHLASLYVLAELCQQMKPPVHINSHSLALKRIIEEIYQADYHCSDLNYLSALASTDILLGWFHGQKNPIIAKTALAAIRNM